MDYPKFEKVDEHTIRIISEKASNVPLSQIIINRERLLGQQVQIEETLKNIEMILVNAKKLGITAENPPKPIINKKEGK